MVLDAVSNFVRGTADAEVGTDDTTVSVDDASIFPDPATDGEFNVVIWDVNNFPRPDQDGDVEILRVTELDTTADELTVTRGQEMTSAASHPEGSAIHLSPTAKMFSDIESTFGDFWDAGTQELTADVNNTNTTTQALEAEAVTTERADTTDNRIGERVHKESLSGSQPDIDVDVSNYDKVDIHVEGETGGGDLNLFATVNNDDATDNENYNYIERDGATFSTVEMTDELKLGEFQGTGPVIGDWTLESKQVATAIFGNAGCRQEVTSDNPKLVQGNYRDDDDSLMDSLQISGDSGFIGLIEIYGRER